MFHDYRRVFASGLLLASLRATLTLGALWIPALFLLLPTLALQLAAPHYLRTRLSPSPWFVVAGSLTIVFLTDSNAGDIRHGPRAANWSAEACSRSGAPIVGASRIRVFVGLLLGVIPGLWLQVCTRSRRFPSTPGRSGACGKRNVDAWPDGEPDAERNRRAHRFGSGTKCGRRTNHALAVVSPAGSIDGRAAFSLHYGYHAITTMIAYGCAAGAATLHAVGVSIVRQTVDEGGAVPRESDSEACRLAVSVARDPGCHRCVDCSNLVAGLAAAAYKIQQHIS